MPTTTNVTINQPTGAGSGVLGRGRTGLWRGQAINIIAQNGVKWVWEVLYQPPDSALNLSGETLTNTLTFTPDVRGTWRIQLTIDDGAASTIFLLGVTKDAAGVALYRGWRQFAFAERAGEANFTGVAKGNQPELDDIFKEIAAALDAAGSGGSIDLKDSVRLASTADVAVLAGNQTIDGVLTATGNRVLLKNQSDATLNGIWTANTGMLGAWQRAVDFDSIDNVTAGACCFVEEGTANGDSGWVLTTNNPITIGVTALTFQQFSGAGQIVAGTGITKSGNTLSVNTSVIATQTYADSAASAAAATCAPSTRTLTAGAGLTGGGDLSADRTFSVDTTTIATRAYVDAAIQGLDIKASVRVATTASITLSGTQTIDGIPVIAGDRVLVKNQFTGSQNGIYVCAAGAWARSTDADADADVTAGMFTFVEEGVTYGDSGWVLTTEDPITVGVTTLTFQQFSGAGQITAGSGILKSGNALSCDFGTTGNVARVGLSASSGSIGQPAKIDHVHQAEDITARTAASALDGNEVVAVSQTGNLRRTTTAAVAALASTLIGAGWFFGAGLDGTPGNMSGVQSALTVGKSYVSLTLNAAAELPAAGHPILCRDTLTLGAGALIRNDGGAGTAGITGATAAGGAGAPAGSLGAAATAGGTGAHNGAGGLGNGGSGGVFTDGLGGNSGAGGAGNNGAGGSGSTIGLPTTRGLLRLEDLTCVLSANIFQQLRGAPGGGGGGGGPTGTGGAGGGGGGGGLVLVRAKKLVMATGAQIRANGGAGGPTANITSGGGGGGGGGCVVVICDELTIADTYAQHFRADGGAAGVASGGGTSGTAGSQGRVFVFVAGKLVYASI